MNPAVAVIAGVAGLWFLLIPSPRSFEEAAVKYAFAAILLFFAYRRFRSSSKKTAEYVKQEAGAGLRFNEMVAQVRALGPLGMPKRFEDWDTEMTELEETHSATTEEAPAHA